MFGKYGPITDVYVPLDYYTRRPRGFAYVQYPCCIIAAVQEILRLVVLFIFFFLVFFACRYFILKSNVHISHSKSQISCINSLHRRIGFFFIMFHFIFFIRIPSLKVKVQGKRMQMYNLAHSIQASDHARSCRKSWEGSSG